MMESTNHRALNDLPMVGRLHRSRFRRVFCQREVRAAIVIIRKVTPKKPAQVILVEDDHMIDAVLDVGFRSGAPHRDSAKVIAEPSSLP